MSLSPAPEAVACSQEPLFETGRVVATRGALSACPVAYLLQCLGRHVRGDWGSMCEEDQATNERALNVGSRIVSAYPIDPAKPCKGYGKNCLWVITEWDRSVTTVLLPEEY